MGSYNDVGEVGEIDCGRTEKRDMGGLADSASFLGGEVSREEAGGVSRKSAPSIDELRGRIDVMRTAFGSGKLG